MKKSCEKKLAARTRKERVRTAVALARIAPVGALKAFRNGAQTNVRYGTPGPA